MESNEMSNSGILGRNIVCFLGIDGEVGSVWVCVLIREI